MDGCMGIIRGTLKLKDKTIHTVHIVLYVHEIVLELVYCQAK